MTNSEPQEPKTAKPPQFSLLTLMLWVTVVGLYFGLTRWVPPIFHENPEISYGVFVIGSIGIYLVFLFYGVKSPSSTNYLIFASGLSLPAALIICKIGGIKQQDLNYEIIIHYGSCSTIFIILIAAIIAIVNCKKRKGSWLPWRGKRAEGESNE